MIRNFFKPLLIFLFFLFFSCVDVKPVRFPVYGTSAPLLGAGRAAQEGILDFSSAKKFEYRFDSSFNVPPDSSLVIEYNLDTAPSAAINETVSVVLDMGPVSWRLPVDYNVMRYSIPVQNTFNGQFNIALDTTEKTEKKDAPVIKITAVRFSERWFGFNTDENVNASLTPFITRSGNGSYEIDVPQTFSLKDKYAEIEAVFSADHPATLEIAGKKIESIPGSDKIYIPPEMYKAEGQAALNAENVISFTLNFSRSGAFPKPIKADPALIIEWPRENWRNKSYEIFRWDRFPSLLIFDYADYSVQDRMLKRLAFFVEKTGFRGRLAPDSEIEELHGWNAHDYRAEDLAVFFDTARKTNFALSNEEKELEKILLNEKIILEDLGGIVPGSGAIISISRESSSYLRYRFMAHEGYHGLFFIDEEFRDFSKKRLQQLPSAARRFIVSFFEFQQYDIKDEYLFVNEFMAHVLQQSVSQAPDYFGSYLPGRLESTWRVSTLPPKDEVSGSWTSLAKVFTDEAQAFSTYVNQRWNLAAGRVWTLRIR